MLLEKVVVQGHLVGHGWLQRSCVVDTHARRQVRQLPVRAGGGQGGGLEYDCEGCGRFKEAQVYEYVKSTREALAADGRGYNLCAFVVVFDREGEHRHTEEVRGCASA